MITTTNSIHNKISRIQKKLEKAHRHDSKTKLKVSAKQKNKPMRTSEMTERFYFMVFIIHFNRPRPNTRRDKVCRNVILKPLCSKIISGQDLMNNKWTWYRISELERNFSRVCLMKEWNQVQISERSTGGAESDVC